MKPSPSATVEFQLTAQDENRIRNQIARRFDAGDLSSAPLFLAASNAGLSGNLAWTHAHAERGLARVEAAAADVAGRAAAFAAAAGELERRSRAAEAALDRNRAIVASMVGPRLGLSQRIACGLAWLTALARGRSDAKRSPSS
jgi:hypothetical protein